MPPREPLGEPGGTEQPRLLGARRDPALDGAALLGPPPRPAAEGDYRTLVTEATAVWDEDEGRVALVYLPRIREDTAALAGALRRLDIREQDRMSGVVSRWAPFGSVPRNGRRQHDGCARAELARDAPTEDALLRAWAPTMAAYYRRCGPGVYGFHRHAAARVLPDWTLGDTPFTGGVINRDAAIPFHVDRGNLRGVWSVMLALRRDVVGGALVVPEYGLGFEIADRSLLMFDGQALVHGVTPLRPTGPGGYRITVVYYTRQEMWQCSTEAEEWRRRQRGATRRRRLRRDAAP